MKQKYTTHGHVNDGCGHSHKSIRVAVQCLIMHQAEIEKTPGATSDRRVVKLDVENDPCMGTCNWTTDEKRQLMMWHAYFH